MTGDSARPFNDQPGGAAHYWRVGTRRPIGVRYALTPTWFKVVKALAQGVDAQLIVAVDLEVDRARIAAAEARAIIAGEMNAMSF